MKKPRIGFIGQGFIGKNYADEFERRGFTVVRYDIAAYRQNLALLRACNIVFVAVPTPTTPRGFQDNILRDAIRKCTVDSQVIVIKSTIALGTTDKLQERFPKRFILHCPEFLTEKTAQRDAAHPVRNVVGYTTRSRKYAALVLSLLPHSPCNVTVPAREAELLKYFSNILLTSKLLVANLFYDLCQRHGITYDRLVEMLVVDKRFGPTHFQVAHTSIPGSKRIGRGAGGHCFIKDLAAFRETYGRARPASKKQRAVMKRGAQLLRAFENYNKTLLTSTGKDLDLLKGVYGNLR